MIKKKAIAWWFVAKVGTIEFVANHLVQILLFLLLIGVSITFFSFAHQCSDPVGQSIASNIATDALFAVFTIYGITTIESYRRKRKNQEANAVIFSKLEVVLKKTMLKLMIEISKGDERVLVRADFDYLIDGEIEGIFKEEIMICTQIDKLILGMGDREKHNIDKILQIRNIIDGGIKELEAVSQKLKPSSRNLYIDKRYPYWEIEDLSSYEKYLQEGEKYGTRYIYEDGYFSGHVAREVYGVAWTGTLNLFKGNLVRNMQYLAEMSESCRRLYGFSR